MSDPDLDGHALQLGALGHPVRLRILRFVVQAGAEGAAAGAVQAHVEMPASSLSHHLKRLSEAGLLTARAQATSIFYAADYAQLRKLTDYLWEDCCRGGADPTCCPPSACCEPTR